MNKDTKALLDTGYVEIEKLHSNSVLPKKKSKKGLKRTDSGVLSVEDKKTNREISSERVVCENVIGMLKRFKILAEKYRNRRRRFGLRFNILAGLYNYEISIR